MISQKNIDKKKTMLLKGTMHKFGVI